VDSWWKDDAARDREIDSRTSFASKWIWDEDPDSDQLGEQHNLKVATDIFSAPESERVE